MTVVIDNASVKLTATKDANARAAAFPGSILLLLHCTSNVNLAVADGALGRSTLGDMITFRGEVSIRVQPGSRTDEMELFARWRFGFMQVSNVMVMENTYAGRHENDGSIIFNRKPAFVPNPNIDADREDLPFMGVSNQVTTAVRTGGTPVSRYIVTCVGGDNPSSPVEYQFINNRSHAPNFLFTARRDEGFLTVFTAIDPLGRRTFLASVPWHVIWHAELRWTTTGGRPVPVVIMKDQRIDVGPVQVGVTGADAAHTDVLTAPITQTVN